MMTCQESPHNYLPCSMETTDLKTGDVVLFHTPLTWRPTSWVAALIRHFTKYGYNHVGVIVCDWHIPMLNESVGSGVKTTPALRRLKGKKIKVLRFDPLRSAVNYPALVEAEFAVRANSLLGVAKYDYMVLFVYQLIKQVTGKWLKKHQDDTRMVCSEYAAWCHETLFDNWDQVAPDDFEETGLFDNVYLN